MPSFAIRRAGGDDADVAAQLLFDFNTEFGDPTPPPGELAVRIRELLDGGDTAVLLGTAGEQPVAVAVAVLRFRLALWSHAKECYLAELYVAPAERGRGLGRTLLRAAIELARGKGAGYMDLGTSEDDVAARKLYEGFGFSRTEGRPGGPLNYYYELNLDTDLD
jgi:ribosomal protein S18 acetylase RimI-like enzyme